MKEKIVFADTAKYPRYINSVWDAPGKNPAPLTGQKKKNKDKGREICIYTEIRGIFPNSENLTPVCS